MAGRRPLLSFGKIFHKTTTASIVQSCTTLDLSDRLCLVHTLYLPLLIYCTVFGRSVVQPGMQALLIGTVMYFVRQASRLRLLQSVYWHIGKKCIVAWQARPLVGFACFSLPARDQLTTAHRGTPMPNPRRYALSFQRCKFIDQQDRHKESKSSPDG